MSLWLAHLSDYKSCSDKKCELGEKGVFLFLCFLQALQQDSDLAGVDGGVLKAVDSLLQVQVRDLGRWISWFRPRFSEPKSGRAWVWELSSSSLSPDSFQRDLDLFSLRSTVQSGRLLLTDGVRLV